MRRALVHVVASAAVIHAVVLVAFLIRGEGGSHGYGTWLIYGAIVAGCTAGLFTRGRSRGTAGEFYATHHSSSDAERAEALRTRDQTASFGLVLFTAGCVCALSGYLLSR